MAGPICHEKCGCCNAKCVTTLFFVCTNICAIIGFILMIYGAVKAFSISPSDANGTNGGNNFGTILGPFLKCSDASDTYNYNSDISNIINYQACAPQAGVFYFTAISALFVIITHFMAVYPYAKETLGSLYLMGVQVSFTFVMVLIAIYVMANETNSTTVQCVPCDGRLTASQQAQLDAGNLPGLEGLCMNGVAGSNPGAEDFLRAVGSYYAGCAISLTGLVIWIWLLAYLFAHREDEVLTAAAPPGSAPSKDVLTGSAPMQRLDSSPELNQPPSGNTV